jgi:hypothetical protein
VHFLASSKGSIVTLCVVGCFAFTFQQAHLIHFTPALLLSPYFHQAIKGRSVIEPTSSSKRPTFALCIPTTMPPKRKAALQAEKQNKKFAAIILSREDDDEEKERVQREEEEQQMSTPRSSGQPTPKAPTLRQQVAAFRRANIQKNDPGPPCAPLKLMLVNKDGSQRRPGPSSSPSGRGREDTVMSDPRFYHSQPRPTIRRPNEELNNSDPFVLSPPLFGDDVSQRLPRLPRPAPRKLDPRRLTPPGWDDGIGHLKQNRGFHANSSFQAPLESMLALENQRPNQPKAQAYKNAKNPNDSPNNVPEFAEHPNRIPNGKTGPAIIPKIKPNKDCLSILREQHYKFRGHEEDIEDPELKEIYQFRSALEGVLQRHRASLPGKPKLNINRSLIDRQAPTPDPNSLALKKLRLAKDPRIAPLFGAWNNPKFIHDEDIEGCSFCLFECDFGVSDERTWLPVEAASGFCQDCHFPTLEAGYEWYNMMQGAYVMDHAGCYERIAEVALDETRYAELLTLPFNPPLKEIAEKENFKGVAEAFVTRRNATNGMVDPNRQPPISMSGHYQGFVPARSPTVGSPTQQKLNPMVPGSPGPASVPNMYGSRPAQGNMNGDQGRKRANSGAGNPPQQRPTTNRAPAATMNGPPISHAQGLGISNDQNCPRAPSGAGDPSQQRPSVPSNGNPSRPATSAMNGTINLQSSLPNKNGNPTSPRSASVSGNPSQQRPPPPHSGNANQQGRPRALFSTGSSPHQHPAASTNGTSNRQGPSPNNSGNYNRPRARSLAGSPTSPMNGSVSAGNTPRPNLSNTANPNVHRRASFSAGSSPSLTSGTTGGLQPGFSLNPVNNPFCPAAFIAGSSPRQSQNSFPNGNVDSTRRASFSAGTSPYLNASQFPPFSPNISFPPPSPNPSRPQLHHAHTVNGPPSQQQPMGPPPIPFRRAISLHDGRDISRFMPVDFCRGSPWRQLDVFKTRICKECRVQKYKILTHRHLSFRLLGDEMRRDGMKRDSRNCMVCTGLATYGCDGCPLRLCGDCQTLLGLMCKGYLNNIFYLYGRKHIRNDVSLFPPRREILPDQFPGVLAKE